jgi:16S rRNA (guanine966-N2)-methyltransferase
VVRIIAGAAKGRQLHSVPGEGTRPISDRVKESLFSILGPDTEDSVWLDLFAGTGSVGIEALSRGARHVVFIDKAHQAVATVRRNLELTGFQKQAQVIRGDALRYLHQAEPDPLFDYIYVAPPQYRDMWAEALMALDQRPLLAPYGQIIVQIHPKEFGPVLLQRLELTGERRYGSTLLLFYEVAEQAADASAAADPDAGTDASGEPDDRANDQEAADAAAG